MVKYIVEGRERKIRWPTSDQRTYLDQSVADSIHSIAFSLKIGYSRTAVLKDEQERTCFIGMVNIVTSWFYARAKERG